MAIAILKTHKDAEPFTITGPLGQKVTLLGNRETKVGVENAHWLARTGDVQVRFDSKAEQEEAEKLVAEEAATLLKPAFLYELPGANANVNSAVLGLVNEPVYILTPRQLVDIINKHVEKVQPVVPFELTQTPAEPAEQPKAPEIIQGDTGAPIGGLPGTPKVAPTPELAGTPVEDAPKPAKTGKGKTQPKPQPEPEAESDEF